MSNGVKALIAGIVLFAVLIEDAGEALENANEANEARQQALAECLEKADGSAKRIRACDEAAGSFP